MQYTSPRIPMTAVLPLVCTTGVSLLATDIYLPSLSILPDVLGGTHKQAQLTLSAFFITFAASQLVYGSLAEAFGKLRILLVAAAIFQAATILAALSQNIETLIIARSLQGIGAAAATAIIPAIIRQTYDEKASIKVFSLLGICQSVIPAMAPLLGALILFQLGWRWNFCLLFLASILSVSLLIRNRAMYRRSDHAIQKTRFTLHSFAANYGIVLTNRSFLSYAFGYSAAYGVLMTFVGSAPLLLHDVYGYPPVSFGLLQTAMVICFMAGSLLSSRASQTLGINRTIVVGLIFLVLTAFLITFTATGILPNTVYFMALSMLPSQFGLGLRFGVAMSASIGSVPDHKASASAMAVFLNFVFAATGNALVSLNVIGGLMTVALVCMLFTTISLLAGIAVRTPGPAAQHGQRHAQKMTTQSK
jgi:DHA1 family bicyclomycin/chloramphenicol resistance-like MFS transporter